VLPLFVRSRHLLSLVSVVPRLFDIRRCVHLLSKFKTLLSRFANHLKRSLAYQTRPSQ